MLVARMETQAPLRQRCIKNQPDSMQDITAWAPEHIGTPVSVKFHNAASNTNTSLYHVEHKPFINNI